MSDDASMATADTLIGRVTSLLRRPSGLDPAREKALRKRLAEEKEPAVRTEIERALRGVA